MTPLPLTEARAMAKRLCQHLTGDCVMAQPERSSCDYANCAVMMQLREAVQTLGGTAE